MGSKPWEKSKSTPDWTDVSALCKAIEALHGVAVALVLRSGVFSGPIVLWDILCLDQGEDANVMGQAVLGLSGEWPCPEHADLVSCLFAGLYTADSKLCSELWKQSKLPFTAE
jgi:hypothetical protein